MLADRRGEALQFLDIEFLARLARVALDQVKRNMGNARPFARRCDLTRGDEGVESFAETGAFCHEFSLQWNVGAQYAVPLRIAFQQFFCKRLVRVRPHRRGRVR